MYSYLTAFRRAFDFKGHSSRKDFWQFFYLQSVIAALILATGVLPGKSRHVRPLEIGTTVTILVIGLGMRSAG